MALDSRTPAGEPGGNRGTNRDHDPRLFIGPPSPPLSIVSPQRRHTERSGSPLLRKVITTARFHSTLPIIRLSGKLLHHPRPGTQWSVKTKPCYDAAKAPLSNLPSPLLSLTSPRPPRISQPSQHTSYANPVLLPPSAGLRDARDRARDVTVTDIPKPERQPTTSPRPRASSYDRLRMSIKSSSSSKRIAPPPDPCATIPAP
jgi:hypothetical protein